MPTYEYECRVCGHKFEAQQKMTDGPLEKCPKCGGSVRRLISTGSGLIFKGTGFYATDHRSQSYKKRQKEEEKKPQSGAACEKTTSSGKCDSCPRAASKKERE